MQQMKEITANKFKIRAGDLAAKRDSLIKRKNANYEIDLKAYAIKKVRKQMQLASLNAEGGYWQYISLCIQNGYHYN